MHSQRASIAWSILTLERLRVAQGQRGYGAWGLSDPVTLHERVLVLVLVLAYIDVISSVRA